jgi:hypothetical protein
MRLIAARILGDSHAGRSIAARILAARTASGKGF